MKRKISSYSDHLSLGASHNIFENARCLRKESTEAELILWSELRNRKINNFKFRRQHPIMHFIADGSVHQEKTISERDTGRENEIKEQGIIILRFTNEEIYFDLKSVLEKIQNHLNSTSPLPLS